MKKLLIVILVIGFGWSSYWWVGATAAKSGFVGWFQARHSEGWLAEYSDIAVRGFPNRFDTTFSELSLADPDTGLAWDVPFFQIFALSYQPNHLIAVWPHDQTIATPEQTLTLKTGDMRASLVVHPGASLALDRVNLVIGDASLVSSQGWQSKAAVLNLAAHQDPDVASTYRVALQTDGLAPPTLFRHRVDPANKLPDTFKTLKVDMTLRFDKPWDRFAIETARPQPVMIDLALAQATWGELELLAAGKVTIDALGNPTGEVTLKAKNWRDITAMARASGEFHGAVIDTVEGALNILSGLSGNPKTLDIPLGLKDGSVYLGPIPVAEAPKLILR